MFELFTWFTKPSPSNINPNDYDDADIGLEDEPLSSISSTDAKPSQLSQQSSIPSQALQKTTNNAASDARKLEWDQNKKRYATAYDEDGNRIEIKRMKNNKLAYLDGQNNKPVYVEENKKEHTFDNGRLKDVMHHGSTIFAVNKFNVK